MRALPLLIALLVALVPLGVAQGQDPPTSASTSSSGGPSAQPCANTADGSPERAQCLREHCTQNQDPRCPPKPTTSHSQTQTAQPQPCANETSDASKRACLERFCVQNQDPRCPRDGNATKPEDNSTRPRDGESCEEASEKPEDAARCERALDDTERRKDGFDHVHFVVDRENGTLDDYRVLGHPVIASIRLDPGSDNFSFDRVGGGLRLGDNDTELTIHDNPTGLLRLKGNDGSLTLAFYADVAIERRADDDGQGARITYGDGRVGLLKADNATWVDNSTVVLSGFASFLVPVRGEASGSPDEPPKAVEAKERVQEALERRHVGAEIHLKAPDPKDATLAASGSNDSIEVLSYDDVEVKVDAAGADPSDPIRIEVSSELDEGRTIVLHLDAALLDSTDPDDLRLRYFDLYNQTDGSVLETEVVLAMASSLTDILDPTDDGGQPEYWVVEDAEGLQVLFSVPHWSAHAITVSSLSSLAGVPSVVAGLVLGVAGSVTAAAMLFWPRRRDEDDEF